MQVKPKTANTADHQTELAELNDCTRARKCHLVPYSKGKRAEGKAPSIRGGCCPGQTGHHLIYDAMVKPMQSQTQCSGYDKKTAPTVCVEGTSQHHGSHKRIHDKMDREVKELADSGGIASDGTMSLEQTINAAAKSHATAFPKSKCNENCIKAQLREYYGKEAKCSKFKAVDKCGKPVKPADDIVDV